MSATSESLRWAVSNDDSTCAGRPGGAAPVEVLIADQDGLARRMMGEVVQSVGGVAAVLVARDGREALVLAQEHHPAVLLVDIGLPPTGSVELIRRIVAILPMVRVVTVSAGADQDRSVLAAFRSGAIGHIDKDIEPDEFARLVRLAAVGEAIVPRRLMTPLLERWRREVPAGRWRPMRSTLTTREWQIIELLGDGATTEQITERLVLSPSTVYSHIYRVLHKLGVHSRRDAVAAARRLRHVEASMRMPWTGDAALFA